MTALHLAGAPLSFPEGAVDGALVDLDGTPHYRVTGLAQLPPFFMSLVSDSDHWLFISSTGALTAGRRDPDQALFPYTTDDRIHDSREITGGRTLMQVTREGRTALWEPFSDRYEGLWRVERTLYKGTLGNRLCFEEQNLDLGLTLRSTWLLSDRWGFVRHQALLNTAGTPVSVTLLDGLLNLMPHGLDARFQMEYSTLADGYKRTERLPDTGLALYRLSSIPVDKAEPSEALRVNVAWSTGLDVQSHLLCARQIDAFRRGRALEPESDIRGQRGAYLVASRLELEAGARKDWAFVAEVGLDASEVTALDQALRQNPHRLPELLEDAQRGTERLRRLVASVDGLQTTGDALSCARQVSNALFNIMRGGVPADGGRVSKADFAAFLAQVNARVAARCAAFLADLPESLSRHELTGRAARQGDPDLVRIASEYLPLTFSRRHGDPSRPWNRFSIRVKGPKGERLLGYEGNWRDLFQNWEALGHTYPDLLEGMIQTFLDASTPDGHNPYRVTREGFQWEVIDPHDAWSFIGYWGDHQVIYLLRLLEASHRFNPGTLARLMDDRRFTFADVPYRLAPYAEMLAHPRNTITFDTEAHRCAMARLADLGTDGLRVTGPEGLSRANLAEKLLLVALSKLWSFVPEAGIWMNTQRPEWNDANNALVGYGVSVVTLAHLRRYLAFCADRFQDLGDTPVELGCELADLLEALQGVFTRHLPDLDGPISDRQRRRILDALGLAGEAYRSRAYAGLSGSRMQVSAPTLATFFRLALQHVDHSLRANRRDDGLYHAYNLLQITDDSLGIRRLQEMLEGQVAVLNAGFLSGAEAADLLDALRTSRLYRADQDSYVLYPDTPLPRFLDKNRIPEAAVAASPLLSAMLQRGDHRLVRRDVAREIHFDAAFRSVEGLAQALDALAGGPEAAQVAAERDALLALYEQVFDHQSFTGRSGTFYKYEGLGCIYWHMVSKLLLAVGEQRLAAGTSDPDVAARLAQHYEAIRAGLGIHKSPADHGAIPTDPYSHTPAFAGAQQPGMTGQVKEDLLARLGELGVAIEDGCVAFRPHMVRQADVLTVPGRLEGFNLQGQPFEMALPVGSLGFTFCQVPVILRQGGQPGILIIQEKDGAFRMQTGLTLDRSISQALFTRSGQIRRLEVSLGLR